MPTTLIELGSVGLPAGAWRTSAYYRLNILAALFNGAVLIAIAVGIVFEAWQRLRNPHPVNVRVVVLLALIGIALNAAGMWLTHARDSSMNLRSTFLQLGGDLLQSVGVRAPSAVIR